MKSAKLISYTARISAESRRVAERFGDAIALRWLDVERMLEFYWRGHWDQALELGEALCNEEDALPLHQVDVLLVGAKVTLAREGADRALESGAKALELARMVGAPQIVYPRLAFQAHALVTAGRHEAGAECAGECLSLWLDDGQGASLPSYWLPDLTFALVDLGLGPELVEAASRARMHTRWLEGTLCAGRGDWQGAARVYARIGSLPDEAQARLRAAATLVAADRAAEAEQERLSASAFYRGVEAPASVST